MLPIMKAEGLLGVNAMKRVRFQETHQDSEIPLSTQAKRQM